MFDKFKAWIKEKTKKKDKRTQLEKRIDELCEYMTTYGEDTDEYAAMAETLKTLTEAQANLKEKKQAGIDGKTWLTVIVSFAQIIIILIWEETHVIRSEALKFMFKIGRK